MATEVSSSHIGSQSLREEVRRGRRGRRDVEDEGASVSNAPKGNGIGAKGS